MSRFFSIIIISYFIIIFLLITLTLPGCVVQIIVTVPLHTSLYNLCPRFHVDFYIHLDTFLQILQCMMKILVMPG